MAGVVGVHDRAEATTPTRPQRPARRRWVLFALFALLLLAAAAWTLALIADDEPTPILSMRGTHLIASGRLSHTLHQRDLPADWRGPVVGPRVRNAAGAECRSFAGRPEIEGPITGTACLIEGDWRIVELDQRVGPPALPQATSAALPAPVTGEAPDREPGTE